MTVGKYAGSEPLNIASTDTQKRFLSVCSVLSLFSVLFVIAMFLGLIRNVSVYVTEGFSTAVTKVLPSVFPFAVLAEILVRSGASGFLGKISGGFCRLLFGTSDECAPAILLGFLCGYPIGAAVASTLVSNGKISTREASVLFAYINNPSPSFVIGVLGVTLFGNIQAGIIIYAIILLSAVICGIICRFKYKRTEYCVEFVAPVQKKQEGFVSVITKSVGAATSTALLICGYLGFFCAVCGVISDILSSFGCGDILLCVVSGFIEIASGVSRAARLDGIAAPVLAAAACSWSGMCVIFQVTAVGGGISPKPLILGKMLQTILSALTAYIVFSFFPA